MTDDSFGRCCRRRPTATFLRDMIGFAAERLMALEPEALCGAALGERISEISLSPGAWPRRP